jgi:ribonuclease HI
MSPSASAIINIDGAARGNPGPAAYAYVIGRSGQPPIEQSGCLGEATNNVAEYTALIKALERATELGDRRLIIQSDSELLVKQMKGEYRVKNDQLRVLHQQASRLTRQFEQVTIRHVPRAENSRADQLCNEALDSLCPSPSAAPGRRAARPSPAKAARAEVVRAEAIRCLQEAAKAWSRGDPASPSPELVWEQLWSILEENSLLRL